MPKTKPMKLIPDIKTKAKSSCPCKECNGDINVGESYVSVIYSDGFRKKGFGSYHKECWDKSADNPRNKAKIQG